MKYQDIHIDDVALWNQFKESMANGQAEYALNLLKEAQLQGKCVNAEFFNTIAQTLEQIQELNDPSFKEDLIKVSEEPPPDMKVGEVYFQIV